MSHLKWDIRFLQLAKQISQWSKDPSTKCGAVIVRPNKSIASTGYNGLPPGVVDSEEILHNREMKLRMIRHAEENAFTFCRDSDMYLYTIYVWPFMPCSNCMSEIASHGIKRVVSVENDNPRWAESFKVSKEVANQCGIEIDLYKPEIINSENLL